MLIDITNREQSALVKTVSIAYNQMLIDLIKRSHSDTGAFNQEMFVNGVNNLEMSQKAVIDIVTGQHSIRKPIKARTVMDDLDKWASEGVDDIT